MNFTTLERPNSRTTTERGRDLKIKDLGKNGKVVISLKLKEYIEKQKKTLE